MLVVFVLSLVLIVALMYYMVRSDSFYGITKNIFVAGLDKHTTAFCTKDT